jgi:hypothetical protein
MGGIRCRSAPATGDVPSVSVAQFVVTGADLRRKAVFVKDNRSLFSEGLIWLSGVRDLVRSPLVSNTGIGSLCISSP